MPGQAGTACLRDQGHGRTLLSPVESAPRRRQTGEVALSPEPGASAFEPAARVAQLASELVAALRHPEFFTALGTALAGYARFQNFIVYRLQPTRTAQLIATNLDRDHLLRQMREFSQGLFLLDPFYISSIEADAKPFLRLSDIAPEDFLETDFYRLHYRNVGVTDECRFIVPIGEADFLHVFVERDAPDQAFEPDEMARLEVLGPLIVSAVQDHWKWWTERTRPSGSSPLGFDLNGVIASIQPKTLTPREIDIVSWMLQGHSSKVIAHRLDIAVGTVTNHKRNIYGKLDIHSQSQLFNRFLQALLSTHD